MDRMWFFVTSEDGRGVKRAFYATVLLACASYAIAQNQAGDTPVQAPTVAPRQPMTGQRMGRMGPSGTVPHNTKTTTVPPDTPVVTVHGVCGKPQTGNTCETVITREDLDKFVSAFAPEASETARGRLAVQYAGMLAFSNLAEQRGLDQDPAFAKQLASQPKLLRMRVVAGLLMQNLQKQTPTIAEPEIQKYYEAHQNQYEEFHVRRLAVPVLAPTESGRRLDRPAIKAEMEDLRSRAIAGGDPNQVLLDTYKHLQIQATPPPASVMTLRRGDVQGDEAKALDLNPGEFSAVLDLPAAFAVMKLESKGTMPIESVHQEIEAILHQERLQDEVREVTKKISAEFNLQYLGMAAPPDIFSLANLRQGVSGRIHRRETRTTPGAKTSRGRAH